MRIIGQVLEPIGFLYCFGDLVKLGWIAVECLVGFAVDGLPQPLQSIYR